MAPRLELQNISRDFGGQRVVSDVSLALEAGEVVCLLGPSGCGKSTTLRIAAGVDQQTDGVVRIDDQIVSDARGHMPPEQRSVGLIFQDFALFPHLNVEGNIGFGVRERSEKAGRVKDLLSRVDLDGFERKMPHELSGGEQQRVALARALAPKPRVLLMDEPFSGLDNRLRDEVRDATLALLKAEDTAVLLVTHEPEEAMRMADRIALMRVGRIVQIGAPYQIYNNPVDQAAAAFFSDINVIAGKATGGATETVFGAFPCEGHADGADVEVIIRPQHIRLDFDRGGNQPKVTKSDGTPALGSVVRARYLGHQSLVEMQMKTDDVLKVIVPGVFLPEAGRQFWLSVPRDRCHVFAKT